MMISLIIVQEMCVRMGVITGQGLADLIREQFGVRWTALIMLLIKSALSDAARARLAATGRMAFTNYLVTSIVMTTIFYGHGLGLFGSIGRATLYLFCFGMWAAMLLWSKPWLERFQYGPLEWLWRSLSRWQVQPMRKIPVA